LREEAFSMEAKEKRKKFDPLEYGLDAQFRLTDWTKLKG
jgi:hypothetical protein